MVIQEKAKKGSSRSAGKASSQEASAVKRQNVTLSLPEPLLRRFRVYAAERGESMTRLMTEAIRDVLEGGPDRDREKRKRRLMDRIRNAPDLGTKGNADWTREDLHEAMRNG